MRKHSTDNQGKLKMRVETSKTLIFNNKAVCQRIAVENSTIGYVAQNQHNKPISQNNARYVKSYLSGARQRGKDYGCAIMYRVYVCVLYIKKLAPPLPYRFRRFEHRSTCMCVRAKGRGTRGRVYPHRHDAPPVGWSGASLVTYGYQVTHIHRETFFVCAFLVVVKRLP